MKIRSEYRKILFAEDMLITEILSENFDELYKALDGEDNNIRKRLGRLNFKFDRHTCEKIKTAAEKASNMPESSPDFLSYPIHMNFELTTKCLLGCPQCYCSLEGGKELDFERATEVLRDGAENGLWEVNLSGGETMIYSHIYDIIKECSKLGVLNNVALSGYGVTKESLDRLIESGVTGIFISLNGSSEEINSHTRMGYKLALNALKLLLESKFSNTAINFVVHNSNCEDLPNMVELCEKYNVKQLVVMAAKPTSKYEMNTVPNTEQTLNLVKDIRKAQSQSSVLVSVENCYSSLRAYMGKSFLVGNTNRGLWRGCAAGRSVVSLNVDGHFTPCRHLLLEEKFQTIGEYWRNSGFLNELRDIEKMSEKPCDICKLSPYCLSCPAINYKTEGKLVKRNKYCAVTEA